jgi:hypothetical protein
MKASSPEALRTYPPREPAPFHDPLFDKHRSDTAGDGVWLSRVFNRARDLEYYGVFSCVETLQGWLRGIKEQTPEEERQHLDSFNEPMVVDHPDYGHSSEN